MSCSSADQALKKVFQKGGVMSAVGFKEKSQVLVEQYGWPLPSAKGYVDGETFRKRGEEPPVYPLAGIDDYSEGFRAGYFDRPLSEWVLSGAPPSSGVDSHGSPAFSDPLALSR
jgi:hypothetical protein